MAKLYKNLMGDNSKIDSSCINFGSGTGPFQKLLANGDILSLARQVDIFATVATNSNTTNIPSEFNYAVGIILIRNAKEPTVILWNQQGQMATNTYINSAWQGWKTK